MKRMTRSLMTANLVLMVCSLFLVILAPSCKSPEQKKLDAEKELMQAEHDLNEAKSDLAEATADSLSELEKFRKLTDERIAQNEAYIADIRAQMETSKDKAKAKYEKAINDLEKKNKEMQKKLSEYKEETADKWEAFKREFNHDMDELGKALKDLTVSNTK